MLAYKKSNRFQHKPAEERFWEKVDKTSSPNGCWLWLACVDKDGYAVITISNKQVRGNRFSYELAKGKIANGLLVLHNCPGGDNRRCVNPAHLWLGTSVENNKDRASKGRTAKGNKHGTHTHPESFPRGEDVAISKLTAEQVEWIRNRYAKGGITFTALAKKFGVTIRSVSLLIKRKTWKHVRIQF